jgi:NAD(P)-dependent dehydrogenase (short-subunit alcohol dehydrogenase family)
MDPATLDQWKAYVDVNLTGNFSLAQAALPFMKVEHEHDKQKRPESSVGAAGPCIVFVSSFRGLVSDPNQEGYAATKAGLIGLTTALAVSAQQWGVRVNCISPGRIKVQHENPEAESEGQQWTVEQDDVDKHLSNRAGLPSDITEGIEYLLGAGFVSGQNLVVDGGVTTLKGGA